MQDFTESVIENDYNFCFFFSVTDLAKTYPPCMRVVVKETSLSKLRVGSLFIVTYPGGSLGREGNDHSILIPDINISKVSNL